MKMVLLACLAVGLSGTALAHPGVDVDIERVTIELANEPRRLDLWVRRGRLSRSAEHYPEALSDLDHARTLDPENLEVALVRGLVLSGMGRYGEARAEIDRVIEAGSASPVPFVESARIHERAGNGQQALDHYTAAIERSHDVEVYVERGRLQESMSRLDEAAAGYRDGLERLSGAVVLRLALLRVETARKQYEAALELIDEELARAQVKTDWYLRRGEVLAAAGRSDEASEAHGQALAEANRVLAVQSTSIRLLSRARVYLALGNLPAARKDVLQVLQRSPRYSEARTVLTELEQAEAEAAKKTDN